MPPSRLRLKRKTSSSAQPAVRSVRMDVTEQVQVEGTPSRSLEFTMIRQAPEQMRAGGLRRPEFLVVRLAVELWWRNGDQV